MDLSMLPNDILVHIAGFINLYDLNNFHQTCKTMVHVGNDNHLWRKAYELHFGAFTNENDKINNNKYENSWKEKYRIRKIARMQDVKAFNTNPTVIPGLEVVQAESQSKTERYAIHFLQDPAITRLSRGVYLSFVDKRTLGVLDAYYETMDFSDMSVLDSLMHLFSYIQFPSHFSVITRFMLCFAQRYYNCNSNSIFKTTDAVYVLSFGIIMLNTDIHNSAVKNKMTLPQYIYNSSGINDGENLPDKMLCDIYYKIKEKPLINNMTPSYESSLWSWVSDWISKLKT